MLTETELDRWTKVKSSPLMAVGVRIPKVFYQEAKRIGKKNGFSFSHFVRRALAREFLAGKEK